MISYKHSISVCIYFYFINVFTMPVKKKIVKKAITRKPTVTVETKKMTKNEICMPHRRCFIVFKFFMVAVILFNTVLLVFLLCQQTKIEAMRVGGYDNYKMLNRVFESDAFRDQQKQQIQQAMQMYQISDTTVTEEINMPIE
ncbi:hypothetical protein KKH82_02420 [Patescibacteria group bacterium]|nr:hypothetical protein [Patescibacteria group bacterium]